MGVDCMVAILKILRIIMLTQLRVGFFGPAHTYPTMKRLGTVISYPKKIQNIYELRDTPLISADISILSSEINKFCYIKKCRFILTFLESLLVAIIDMAKILMIPAKMATPGLLKIKVF